MRPYSTIVTLSSLLYLSKCQTITLDTSQSSNNYLHTQISWGTPPQTFNVLVDTTDNTSWVYNASVNTPYPKFDPSQSTTFTPSNNGETFSYQGEHTSIEFCTDNFSISSQSIPNQRFAVAKKNFSITDNEGISGFLSLDRLNKITSGLHTNGYIENETISIDVANNKLYIGPYRPSSSNLVNQSNATYCASSNNQYLANDWTFNITISVNGVPTLGTNTFQGVIDSASPFITIYAKSQALFNNLWILLDGTGTESTLHCNYSTRYCANTNIMDYMTIAIPDSNDTDNKYTLTIFKEDVLSGDYIQFFYDADRDFTTDVDYVLFLGRPFLKHALVTLNYYNDSMIFYALKPTTTSLNWLTIGIVFACVIVFALLFFGVYYWRYGKIPPPSNNDVEEQSLLRGPVQAVGTGQGNVQNQGASSGVYSGISGLDEEDDEYQRQLQQAQRQSAIEAQQMREQQARIERERQMAQEQKQQAELQQAQRQIAAQKQRIGSKKGDAKPSDAEDLRKRRLKFLEEQEKQQQQQQEEDADQ